MPQKKHLVRISFALICINLVLAGLMIFNHYQVNKEIEYAKAETPKEVLGVSNVPIFDPSYIMADESFRSTRAFPNQQAVQNYLDRTNSPLRSYTTSGQPASYWIFAAARGQTSSKWGVVPQINPGVLLAYLEKEQSLISLSNYDVVGDPNNRIKTAMGYGCPDTAACDTQYYGLANQLNWASYQLQFNFDRATQRSSLVAPYHVQNTITTLDEYSVFLSNAATAANYRYTPHSYWGNYNLWKIMTANGWGISSQTHSFAQIDAVNIPLKDKPVATDAGPAIPYSQVEAIIRKDYQIGTQNEEIKLLQRFLRQQNYYTSRDFTGLYGVVTERAHMNYRRDKGVLNTSPNDRCKTLFAANWQVGQAGDDVKTLQQCLKDAGFFDWPVITGYYGQVSQQGLEAVRKALGNQQPAAKPATPADSCEGLYAQAWKTGETSDRVKQLQGCLRRAGTFNWPSDTGYFGSVTEKALNDYKASKGQPAAAPAKPANRCTELKGRNWSVGQAGGEVQELQNCLTAEGHYSWPAGATGYFGPVTQQALARARGQGAVASSCESLKAQTWKQGETSERVRQLQVCMQKAGVYSWPAGATGYFGDYTRESIIRWRGFA